MTLRWWNDLWLNEGFASYVEYLGADSAEPTWDIVSAGASGHGRRARVWDVGHVYGTWGTRGAQGRVKGYRAWACCIEHKYGTWGTRMGRGAWVWGMRHVYGARGTGMWHKAWAWGTDMGHGNPLLPSTQVLPCYECCADGRTHPRRKT